MKAALALVALATVLFGCTPWPKRGADALTTGLLLLALAASGQRRRS